MSDSLSIPPSLAQATLAYLVQRPYQEVWQLVANFNKLIMEQMGTQGEPEDDGKDNPPADEG